MVLGFILGLMEVNMRACLLMDLNMEKENGRKVMMGINISGNMHLIGRMDMGSFHGQVAINIKGFIKMIREMGMER
jgi:hypothetical protein